jgi:hypothetical protein
MIVFALVARGTTILAQWKGKDLGTNTINDILKRLDTSTNTTLSYAADISTTFAQASVFHIVIQDGLTYLCVVSDKTEQKRAIVFLKDLQKKFVAKYKDWKKMEANSGADFTATIEKQAVICLIKL